MLVNSAADGDLLSDFCAGWAGQAELGRVGLDTQHLGTGGGRTNVHHQHFILG